MVGEIGPRATWDGALLTKEGHARALAAAARRRFIAGEFLAGFQFADRRCRLPIVAQAWHHLLRALALHALGHEASAAGDLERALDLDATDPFLNRAILERGATAAARLTAARALVENPRTRDDGVRAAIVHLGRSGEGIVLHAWRNGDSVSGWVAWTGQDSVALTLRTEGRIDRLDVAHDPDHPLSTLLGGAAAFERAYPASHPLRIEARVGAIAARSLGLYPHAEAASRRGTSPGRRSRPSAPACVAAPPAGLVVNVIVPVYGDFEATRACLDALAIQRTACALRVVVVDDDTPDARIAEHVDRFCRAEGAHRVRNAVNHGFAASVNKALALCPEGDVLLLNADAILPAGAIDRFAAVAHGGDAIGTVLPLSNDSEFTSFPNPNVPNPFPDAEGAAGIDAAAFAANGHGAVDLVNGIGFCLYVTRACLDAVGPLSLVYGRGYYEDVDFCLRARERGFRNVAATGLYVAHASGRSFAGEKRGWVARNYPVLEARFPAYTLACATFLEADPLRAARSAIEARLPPRGAVSIVVGRADRLGPALGRRARDLAASGARVLTVGWRRGGADGVEVVVRSPDGEVPQSLAFPLGGSAALGSYLGMLAVRWIELAERAATPLPLLAALSMCSAPIYDLVADREAFEAAPSAAAPPASASAPPGLVPGSRLIAADRMARACCDRLSRDRRGRRPRPSSRQATSSPRPKARVGVLVPLPTPDVDRLLLRIAGRGGRPAVASLVVLGETLDDLRLMSSSAAFVSGAVAEDEYPAVVAHYGVDALLLPYRARLFGFLDEVARTTGLAKAYFDWSGGLLEADPDDLVLDPDAPDAAVATAVAAWCAP